MDLILDTAPAVEPVSVDEAKLHLRIIGSDENAYLEALIKAARQKVELDTGRALITQRWKAILDDFPGSRFIVLPKTPLSSVVSVKYYNSSGVLTTISSADYLVHTATTPGAIELRSGLSWPVTREEAQAVEILFEAGYGAAGAAVEHQLRHAIKFLVSHWFSVREPINLGTSVSAVPQTYDFLTLPFKVYL